MESIFKTWRTSRQLYSQFFDRYSLAQLNTVPQGFNNNLIWNIGHVIVAQQSLVYKSSGQPMLIPDELFERYKPGTKPEATVSEAEASQLRELLTAVIEQTETDFRKGHFMVFQERTTVTGFHLGSVNDALLFNNYHEGIHLGYMMSIKKFV